MTDPVLIDVPERLEGERVLLLAPRAGLGAEMAVVVAQSISHLRPWMPWAQEPPSAESAETVVRKMQADFVARRDLAYQVFTRKPDGNHGDPRPASTRATPRGGQVGLGSGPATDLRGRLFGGAGLHRIDWAVRRFEIGYWVRPEAQGQGLVSECVELLARMAFDQLQARRLEIRCDARNARSRAVAVRCGFELEGVLKQEALGVDGHPRDTCVYARLRAPADPPRP